MVFFHLSSAVNLFWAGIFLKRLFQFWGVFILCKGTWQFLFGVLFILKPFVDLVTVFLQLLRLVCSSGFFVCWVLEFCFCSWVWVWFLFSLSTNIFLRWFGCLYSQDCLLLWSNIFTEPNVSCGWPRWLRWLYEDLECTLNKLLWGFFAAALFSII